MAMALAAVVMAGVTVSCDPMDKDDDQQEQTGGDTNTPSGDTNNPSDDNNGSTDTPATLSIDGKQWEATWDMMMNVPCVFDFGLTTAETFYFAYDTSTMEGPGWMTYFSGTYTVTPTDETSGTILMNDGYGEVSLSYSNLTADSVVITSELTYQEDVTYTLVTEEKTILDQMGNPIN